MCGWGWSAGAELLVVLSCSFRILPSWIRVVGGFAMNDGQAGTVEQVT